MAFGSRASARPKLVEPSGFATPARAKLALAIAAKAAADDGLDRLQTSRQKLFENFLAARRAVTEAEAEVQRAQDAAAAYALAVATGGAAEPPAPVKAARAALNDAQDALAAADAARCGLNAHVELAEQERLAAKRRVEEAATAVLREAPQVAGLLGSVQRQIDELISAGQVLSFLISNGVLPGRGAPNPIQLNHPDYVINRVREFVMALPIGLLPGAEYPYRVIPLDQHPAAAAWKDALAALMVDANSPLPGNGS